MQPATIPFRPTDEQPKPESPAAVPAPKRILVVDIGGSKVKFLATGQTEPRKMPSGTKLTPAQMVEGVRKLTRDWEYDAVSIGYPGLVGPNGPRSEAGNLGHGWVGFNYAAAFEKPVRITNDAAMQALGSYEGGRMLFLGLGTGLGSVFIAENVIVPLELGQLRGPKGGTLGETLGRDGLERLGKSKWIEAVKETVAILSVAFAVNYVVIGGGNAKKLKNAVPEVHIGHNLTAFRGGERLWNIEDLPTMRHDGATELPPKVPSDWRVV